MFVYCPKCKGEYVEGIEICPVCDEKLVDELVEDQSELDEKYGKEPFVVVLSTGDRGLVAVIKSLLEDAGIRYMVRGEELQDLFGGGSLGFGFNPIIGPIEILVSESDAEDVIKLIEQTDIEYLEEEDENNI